MARDFVINGETLVKVKFGAHIPASVPGGSNLSELGLATERITVTPKFFHKDIYVNDFGPNTPAEVLAMMGDCTISMNLIHYDKNVLDTCIAESQGGTTVKPENIGINLALNLGIAGVFNPTGTVMGGEYPTIMYLSGCHYMGLNLSSPVLEMPWRFRKTYLIDTVRYPLGTEKSIVSLNWRAIPYQTPPTGIAATTQIEILSSGAVLYDHLADT